MAIIILIVSKLLKLNYVTDRFFLVEDIQFEMAVPFCTTSKIPTMYKHKMTQLFA